MTSPSLELQEVLVARLKGWAGLTALVVDRVYDDVPANATFPYVSLGPDQALSEDADCITGFDITLQIDAWSKKPGRVEAKTIAEQVRLSLHDYETSLTDNAVVSLLHSQTRVFPDPDGETMHAVIEFSAFIEQP